MVKLSRQEAFAELGVADTASDTDVRVEYKKLAREWHPDKNTSEGATEKFQKINAAYHRITQGGQDDEKFDHFDEEDIFDFFEMFFFGGRAAAFRGGEGVRFAFSFGPAGTGFASHGANRGWNAYAEDSIDAEDVDDGDDDFDEEDRDFYRWYSNDPARRELEQQRLERQRLERERFEARQAEREGKMREEMARKREKREQMLAAARKAEEARRKDTAAANKQHRIAEEERKQAEARARKVQEEEECAQKRRHAAVLERKSAVEALAHRETMVREREEWEQQLQAQRCKEAHDVMAKQQVCAILSCARTARSGASCTVGWRGWRQALGASAHSLPCRV